MDWLILCLAGLLEVVWAAALKSSCGFTRLWPSLLMLTALAGSMLLLALAVRHLPIGTAYAVWTGIGAAGTVVAGIFLYGESFGFLRLFFLLLILIGIAGLKLCPR